MQECVIKELHYILKVLKELIQVVDNECVFKVLVMCVVMCVAMCVVMCVVIQVVDNECVFKVFKE